MQYPIQQQINATNLMYNAMRSSPSPHQGFMSLEYGTQLPMMLPYGHSPLHMYPQGIRNGRRDGDPSTTLRSALLDDFRANKSRKWELRVSILQSCTLVCIDDCRRTYLVISWNSAVINTVRGLYSRNWRRQLARKNKLFLMRLFRTMPCNLFKTFSVIM